MTRVAHTRPIAAIAVAMAVHAAAAVGIMLEMPRAAPAADPGTGELMIVIAAVAAGSAAGSSAPAQKPEKTPRVDPDIEKAPNAAPAGIDPPHKPLRQFDIEKQDFAQPVVREVPVKKITQPRRADVVPVPPPKRKPVYRKPAAATPSPAPTPAPAPTPTPTPTPSPPARAPENSSAPGSKPAAITDRAGTSVASANGDQGASRQTQIARSGGGEASIHGAYFAAVRDWLQEHKRYPRRARLRMMRGEALLDFVLEPSGRVISFELHRSSGHSILDREVFAMLRRASPMPAFPPGMEKKRMRFTVPVTFDMR